MVEKIVKPVAPIEAVVRTPASTYLGAKPTTNVLRRSPNIMGLTNFSRFLGKTSSFLKGPLVALVGGIVALKGLNMMLKDL